MESNELIRIIFGTFDENVQNIESNCEVQIVSRGNGLLVRGEQAGVDKACRVLSAMKDLAQKQVLIDIQTVRYCSLLARRSILRMLAKR